MITCEELTRLVTDYLEGRLPWTRRFGVRLHLAFCRDCSEYLRQMRATIRAAGELPPEPMPEHVRDELLKIFDRSRVR